MNKKFLTVTGLIAVGIAGRLLPHLPNTTPINAITLTAGKYVGRVWAFVIPIAAMLASDAVIGFYNWKILLSVYASFLGIGLLSIVAKQYPKILPTGFAVVGASLTFFLTTNFAVWIFSPWYAKSISGLLFCYTLGLPFLRNMLLGDIAYTLILSALFKTANSFNMPAVAPFQELQSRA